MYTCPAASREGRSCRRRQARPIRGLHHVAGWPVCRTLAGRLRGDRQVVRERTGARPRRSLQQHLGRHRPPQPGGRERVRAVAKLLARGRAT